MEKERFFLKKKKKAQPNVVWLGDHGEYGDAGGDPAGVMQLTGDMAGVTLPRAPQAGSRMNVLCLVNAIRWPSACSPVLWGRRPWIRVAQGAVTQPALLHGYPRGVWHPRGSLAPWVQPGLSGQQFDGQCTGQQRELKAAGTGTISLCGSVCSAFCHLPVSAPNRLGGHRELSACQAEPHTHGGLPPAPQCPQHCMVSPEHTAMLGTPISLLSYAHPSAAGSLGT